MADEGQASAPAAFDPAGLHPLVKIWPLLARQHGKQGFGDAGPGVTLAVSRPKAIVQLVAHPKAIESLARRAGKGGSPTLPDAGRWTGDAALTLIWAGQASWLAVSERHDAAEIGVLLAPVVDDLASMSDQTDGRVMLTLSGRKAAPALGKLTGIDLHDQAFPAGASAATGMFHLPVVLQRLGDSAEGPAYRIVFYSSYAQSMAEAVTEAAGEYGLLFRPLSP